MSSSSDLRVLAGFASGVQASELAADIVTTAKACLLYGLAVGIGTRRIKTALAALAASRMQDGDRGDATRLIDGSHSAHANAAYANAVLMSSRVQGDSHPCGHLGGVVIPAALASAERAKASGSQFLSGMIAGYEVALRIGRDHAADLSLRGFRTTPCYGVFGAAAAAGRLRGFSAEQMTSAFGLAANFAGGLREYVDAATEESPFQAGFAARNGLHVADLIECGIGAAPSALHGQAGFYRAFAKKGIDYGHRLIDDLGSDYEFTRVTFKEYPACQFLRGIVRGLALLRAQASGAQAKRIELRMNQYEADFIGVRHTGPFVSATQTVMSAPFCAALAWTSGTANYAGLRLFTDPQILALIPKISVISDSACKRYEPLLTVTLENGSVLKWKDEGGDASYRLTWADAARMTHELCREVDVSGSAAGAVIDEVNRIEQRESVMPLIGAVCAATTAG